MNKLSILKAQKTKLLNTKNVTTEQQFELIQDKLNLIELQIKEIENE